ncbi:D-inositol-3-phosphate glycosyltransferase [Halomonadaceae bacterium LMG 33818]|uniref:glycosyltransferase family 4 protein n=1 Tax=Cernens ardua TaxID=3402176 RepID=UPI003EDBCECA
MKIHYLVTSLETGGAEFSIPEVVTALQRLGHDVHIIACEPRDMGAAPRLDAVGLGYRILCSKRRPLPVVLGKYLNVVRKDRPDIIWTSLSWGTRIGQWAGRITRIPVISFKHSASVRRATYRMRYMSKLWIGDSQTVVHYLHEKMGIPLSDTLPLPLYISDENAPSATGWDGKSRLELGSVGRLHKVKNYDQLIKGVALFICRHPEWKHRLHLTIAGDGAERETLEKLIRQLKLEEVVSLPGHSDEINRFLAGLHLYAQPSRYEGMCLAAHEAMNAALPVMATPVGELRYDVEDNKTGFILQGNISQAVCKVLEQVFATPDALAGYGQNAQDYVRRTFSKQKFEQAISTISSRFDQYVDQTRAN